MTLTTAQLLSRHGELWEAATTHKFLDQVRDGSLPEPSFARWLEQDYLFVVGLARAWGQLLRLAPVEDFPLLAGGIAAFSDELAWFGEIASSRELCLESKPEPTAAAYVSYLDHVAREPYAVAMTAMWGVEAAYLQAWQGARSDTERYADIVEHWASDEFEAFVAALAASVDRELAANSELQGRAEQAFKDVARHEASFWDLATTS